MKKIAPWVLAAAVSACGGTTQPQNDATSNAMDLEAPQTVQYQRGLAPQTGATTASNLIDHGGRVLAASKTYNFWWGPSSGFPSDAVTGITALFQGFNGTSFLGIGQQYMRGAAISTSFAGNYFDGSAPPTRAPSTSTIVNEACKVINANGLVADPTAIYFIYTTTMPSHVNYCAWHSSGTCNGVSIAVAYMPNTAGVAGCDPGDLYACNSYSQGTRSLANVTSHEYMEALTDALPGSTTGAWIDSGGAEIGDKCAWTFNACVNLPNGKWQLQQEWSNAISGCQQQ